MAVLRGGDGTTFEDEVYTTTFPRGVPKIVLDSFWRAPLAV